MWYLIARVALGAFFFASGIAKVASPGQNAAAARGLGVPAPIAAAAGPLLAPAEMTIGAGLIVSSTAPLAAAGALIVLAILTAVVVGNLMTGRRPECGCFGSLSRAAIGWSTVARNLALMSIAGVTVAQAVGSHEPCRLGCYGRLLQHGQTILAAGLGAESLLLVILVGLVIRLTLQAGRVQLRLAALEAADVALLGAAASRQAWPLPGQAGAWLDRVTAGALVFVSDGCSACDRLLTELAADQLGSVPVLLVARGLVHGSSAHPLIADERGELRRVLAVDAFPTAVACDVAAGVTGRARGLPDVLTLLRGLAADNETVLRELAAEHE
jgi:uncharacterized membrane protein YphA (DoxX/SURF4 family)